MERRDEARNEDDDNRPARKEVIGGRREKGRAGSQKSETEHRKKRTAIPRMLLNDMLRACCTGKRKKESLNSCQSRLGFK
jgi:hypothetical protein